MRIVLVLALLSACRRKHQAPPVVEEVAPPPVVEEAPPPVVRETPPAPVASPTGHPPRDDELRDRLRPLLPALAKCVALLRPEGPVVLHFAISPSTGGALDVKLSGRPDECSAQALSALRFDGWSGLPSIVELPLTREGRTMTETDGGLK